MYDPDRHDAIERVRLGLIQRLRIGIAQQQQAHEILLTWQTR
jgi:hypothetical protein